MIKNIIIILFYCFLTSCHSQEDNNALLVAQFEKQDCRLEFVEHQLFYNGKVVKLDQPLSYYDELFGNDYKVVDRGRIIEYNKKPFKRVVRSYSGAMERQYTDNAYNWLEYIYIYLWGRESDNKVNYIDYGNASTDSD